MEHPVTKEDFLRRIRTARDEWEAALADVGVERMGFPGVSGNWSVLDIVAHTAYGQRWLVGQLRAERQSVPPTPHACYGDALPPQDLDMADAIRSECPPERQLRLAADGAAQGGIR